MLSPLWRALSRAAAFPPLLAVRGLRRLQRRRSRLVRVDLAGIGGTLGAELALLDALSLLAADPAIEAVLLDLRGHKLGLAGLHSLRAALLHLRASGKRLHTHVDAIGLRELFLASACDRVWLTPAGEAHLAPLEAQLLFFGGLLDTIGVQVDMEAAGTFKSFAEPYTRSHPSPANRTALAALLGDLQEQLVEAIAEGRHLAPAVVEEALQIGLLSAEQLLALGLVDALAYPDTVEAELEATHGPARRWLPLPRHSRLARWERRLRRRGAPRSPTCVVVHLEGPIVQGDEAEGGAGSRVRADRVVPVLDELREDEDVGAVVLYVNSPGGSALASDLIARAVSRLNAAKPVVALFGDVSASGGYYLSAPASEILASPCTLTGSIGVVGGKVALGGALTRVGLFPASVTADGSEGGMWGPFAPFTPSQRVAFRAMLDRTYARFLQVVATGRRRPVEEIAPHAEGRVWTGRAAQERGLVDHLGGIELAVERARALAGLGPGLTVHISFAASRLDRLKSLLRQGGVSLLNLPVALLLFRRRPAEALALLPYTLTFR